MRKYYIYSSGKLHEVDCDTYREIGQLLNQVHYRAELRNECRANRRQRAVSCDGDCVTCRYHCHQTPSLDALREKGNILLPSYYNGCMDTQMMYRCIEILADMQRVDSDGERIGRMIMAKYKQAEIAAALNIPVSTYRDRLARIGRKIRGE